MKFVDYFDHKTQEEEPNMTGLTWHEFISWTQNQLRMSKGIYGKLSRDKEGYPLSYTVQTVN